MSVDPGPGEALELKLIFLRELSAGYGSARESLGELRGAPGDAHALDDLRRFFHRIAGTSAPVGLELLGRLAAACENTADAIRDGSMTPSSRSTEIFADGLAGVASVLEGQAVPELVPPARASFTPLLEGAPSRILVVDDDPLSARLIDGVLRAAGLSSTVCCDPAKALEVIEAENPDLIVLDVVMPQVDGFDVCRRVRANPVMQHTPIIFVTRKGDVEQRVRGLQVGGNDYVSKPFEPQELVARVRSHLDRLAALREMAVRDGLTRCYNQKYFKARLEQELLRARRYGTELTVGMLDIDHFKRVNDSYGHPAGDEVLAHLASILTAAVRSTDVVARYGGEEFGFLLVEAAIPEATIVTNRLRERIARHRFELPPVHGEPVDVSATVSIGLASLRHGDDCAALLHRADEALYAAKKAGRNQVIVGG